MTCATVTRCRNISLSPPLPLAPSTALALWLAHAAITFAQQPPADPPGRWQLELVTLKSGAEHQGLVQSQSEAEIDFAEIIQPPGKPMYAVIRGIPREAVAKLDRLDDAAHEQLAARFRRFRHKAVIELGRMEQVELREETRDGSPHQVYDGSWFMLSSTADSERTRQCVVRIEQIFRAYRTLLPPRIDQPQPLFVTLYGSLDDYRSRLRRLDLSLDNAAFYSPRERTILAGSDLNLFAERLDQVQGEHEEVKRNYARLDAEFAKTLATLSADLKAGGFSDDEATAEIRQRKATWKAEMEKVLAANALQQRTNEQKFAEVTRQMFSRLYHEAFHAYLDTFVYPHDSHHVPRWLNEGLAQVFESGQLDGDSLRIDAPDRDRLRRLREDLAVQPLPLAQLLTAQEREFLGPHGDTSSQRHYLYAWGLAYYLAFDENLLGTPRFDAYVAGEAKGLDPIVRFERLVNAPLPQFERRWREAMAVQ
ncbi:MAG TPA: DUF1570 domain-containing protein [Pirellulaceae bacterium]|nr:DUF1570 domain-containing protein [Pirellulaceae bacterium]